MKIKKYIPIISIITLILIGGILSPIKVSALTKEFPTVTVDKDKKFTISFNNDIAYPTINESTIKVFNSLNEESNIMVTAGKNDNKTVIVTPPVSGYTEGETYTLIVTKGLLDVRRSSLIDEVQMKFIIKTPIPPIVVVNPLLAEWYVKPPTTSSLNTNLRNMIMNNFPNYGAYNYMNGLKRNEFSELTKSIALGADVKTVRDKILAMKWNENFLGGEGEYGVGTVNINIFDDSTNNAYVIANRYDDTEIFGDTYVYYDALTKKNKVVEVILSLYYNE